MSSNRQGLKRNVRVPKRYENSNVSMGKRDTKGRNGSNNGADKETVGGKEDPVSLSQGSIEYEMKSNGENAVNNDMTARMCQNGVGMTDYARVMVEFEACRVMKNEIKIEYTDKERKLKGTKMVNVMYDRKPESCDHYKNIRSMNKLKKQKEVERMIVEDNIQVCAILETHVKPHKLPKVCEKAFGNWSWISNVSNNMNGCRILVGWNNALVNLMVLNSSRQSILSEIETIPSRIKVFCSFMYAANTGRERNEDLIDCVNDTELEDLCSTGLFYTWIKSPMNPQNTKSALI
ncbi:RNA-directed DNA polymerase, eukaryota, Reverse transcriptase zinc-binding domain protein [Artemisia annua]|uniref:RNA-directed DNA polymerase, eukaryota, Reverse transcriptase zinc-binding domain protein n=1 Tax=Artemisia annua TaxID=35608 RepID=A0A2U1NB36_ARTAN|nr:RNA-directed DNA polymerase, eukaryota, Reverse transcriptase zinc-binding domain protein [Artemisia annua]